MASASRILERKALPRPSPSDAPLTIPAISTKDTVAGKMRSEPKISARRPKRGSGSSTNPTVGSIVAKGEFAAKIAEQDRALNKVDLPTLGKPTIPSVRLTRIILTHTNAGVAEWAACSLNSWLLVQYRTVSSNDSQTPEQGGGEHSMSQNRSDD